MARIVQNTASQEPTQTKEVREMAIADSSFLQHIKYDAANFQLTVTMKTGAQYIHFYVYPAIVDDFFLSPSKGAFYSQAIKGKHPSTRTISKAVGKPIKKKEA